MPWNALRDGHPAARLKLASHWVVVRKFVDQLTGESAVTFVLVESYCSGTPEVTADYVAVRLGSLMSDDTARRKLNAMLGRSVVECRRAGRTRYYWLKPEIAEAVIQLMEGGVAVL